MSPRDMFPSGICFSTAHVFPRNMCSHGFSWHMFFPGTCFPSAHIFHGTCFPVTLVDTYETNTKKRHVFLRHLLVAHVFLRHMFSHDTCFPPHVFPLMRQTLKRNTVPQYRSWHICSHGICFPTAHVFPRHMCSHGLSWHMFSLGTRFNVTYFPVAHVFHRHMFSLGICFPTAHVFPSHMCSRGFLWHMHSLGTRFTTGHIFPRHMFSRYTCYL